VVDVEEAATATSIAVDAAAARSMRSWHMFRGSTNDDA
jgi:hypothetical protein